MTKKFSLFREPDTPPASVKRTLQATDVALEALESAAGEMEASNVSRLVSSITHEIRTPLAAIQGFAQLLHDEIEEDLEEHHEEFLTTILRSVTTCMQLVDDLSDFAEMEEGEAQLQMGPVDAGNLADIITKSLHPLAAERGVFVHHEVEEGAGYAHADENRLRLLITHLVKNGIKYTNDGGITIHIAPATLGEIPAVQVDVTHTGQRYGKDLLPAYMDHHTRESRMTFAIENGTGISLAVAFEYLMEMGGRLTVSPHEELGETFTILLPAANV